MELDIQRKKERSEGSSPARETTAPGRDAAAAAEHQDVARDADQDENADGDPEEHLEGRVRVGDIPVLVADLERDGRGRREENGNPELFDDLVDVVHGGVSLPEGVAKAAFGQRKGAPPEGVQLSVLSVPRAPPGDKQNPAAAGVLRSGRACSGTEAARGLSKNGSRKAGEILRPKNGGWLPRSNGRTTTGRNDLSALPCGQTWRQPTRNGKLLSDSRTPPTTERGNPVRLKSRVKSVISTMVLAKCLRFSSFQHDPRSHDDPAIVNDLDLWPLQLCYVQGHDHPVLIPCAGRVGLRRAFSVFRQCRQCDKHLPARRTAGRNGPGS